MNQSQDNGLVNDCKGRKRPKLNCNMAVVIVKLFTQFTL